MAPEALGIADAPVRGGEESRTGEQQAGKKEFHAGDMKKASAQAEALRKGSRVDGMVAEGARRGWKRVASRKRFAGSPDRAGRGPRAWL